MSESVTIMIRTLAIVAVFAMGLSACDTDCDCPDCSGAAGTDGGVTCESEPGVCADIGDDAAQHFGCCFDGAVYWCDGDVLESVDCLAGGYDCGYSATGDYMDCI